MRRPRGKVERCDYPPLHNSHRMVGGVARCDEVPCCGIRITYECAKCGHAWWGAYKSWDHDIQLEKRCRGFEIPKLISTSLCERGYQ